MNSSNFSSYQSVFSWRYGSEDMRKLFSLENRFKTWRKIWVALAQAQYKAGLVSKKELQDIEKHQNDVDIDKIFEIEKETKHDVVAAIAEFAQKAKIGGGKIHLGATSMDIVDNSDAILIKQALTIIEQKVKSILKEFAKLIKKYYDLPCIGYTHLQPAEPTTVGYRLSFYAQDLLLDVEFLQFLKATYKGKGIKGAVGTGATFSLQLENQIMDKLGISPLTISSQVATRKLDYFILSFLNSLSSSCAKFAEDLRILQSPPLGEWSEPFAKTQVGSSAMPFKKNPINSEKICSLARYVAQFPNIALENATLSHLERTLDDSANRRIIIPESFLATDEILKTTNKIISGLLINEKKIAYNLAQYAPFAATEIILAQSVKKGADRQKMHQELKDVAMKAWEAIHQGRENPMHKLLNTNKYIQSFLNESEITQFMDVKSHVGDAPKRCLFLLKQIKKMLL